MSATAFNRARRQRLARQDAENRKPREIEESQEAVKAVPDPVENLDELGSPPYADEGQLINIVSGTDLERDRESWKQAELNKTRVLSPEELAELQNSHLRDPKTKAIPNPDEAGADRTLKGQESSRRKAGAPYRDKRVKPQEDGRIRATEPEEERPDADTTVSEKTAQDQVPPSEDDDPKLIEKIDDEPPPPPKRRGRASQQTPGK